MADTAQKLLSPDEFLLWQLDKDDPYELVGGVPLKMMTGASEYHDLIVINIIATLHAQLRGSRCRPTTDDIAVKTKLRSVRRPDVTVTCTDPRPDVYDARDPRMVAEVLSPSNNGVAWELKLEEYRRVNGLSYILLIESRSVNAMLYTRHGGSWEPSDADDIDAVFDLPDIGCRLAMREIYEGLTFDETDAARG